MVGKLTSVLTALAIGASSIYGAGCNKEGCDGDRKAPEPVVELGEMEEVYDYCVLAKEPTKLDKYYAGESSTEDLEVLVEGVQEDTHSSTMPDIALEDIFNPGSLTTYRTILVPIGYDDIAHMHTRMEYFATVLEKGFKGIKNVSFSYLGKNVVMGIDHINVVAELSNEDDLSELHKKINKMYRVDGIVLAVNAKGIVASASVHDNLRYAVVSERYDVEAVLVHEVGHFFGLDDGYEAFYGKEKINGTELFVSIKDLPSHVRKAYARTKPRIVNTGNVCDGEPVYTFYGLEYDVMDDGYDSADLKTRPPFNPLQKEVMNMFVQEYLHKKWRK